MSPRSSSATHSRAHGAPVPGGMVQELAQFRYSLRKFLRFSELAARRCGVTPQQHQLMLGVQGFTGRGSATISELAEFLQERHHSVVGLVERAVRRGLLIRKQDTGDRRVVNVSLTPAGAKILSELTKVHYAEAKRLRGLRDEPLLATTKPTQK